MLELKDICFNVRQDSKEKEILKNNIAFRKILHNIKRLIIVEFTVVFK